MRLEIVVPTAEFISANDRLHWAEEARRTRTFRLATRAAATGHAPCAYCGKPLLRRKDGSVRQHASNKCPGKTEGYT